MNNSEDKTNHAPHSASQMPIGQFADRLGALMRKMAGTVYSAERHYLARGVITLPQLWVLREIAEKGSCPMLAIARNLAMKSSTVTGVMDRLVKLGLVKRYSSQSDRRSVLAEATPKGRRILEQIHAERRRTFIKVYGSLSSRERADYLAIIEKVMDQITAKNKKPDKGNH